MHGWKVSELLSPLQALYVTDHCQAGTVFVNTYNKTDVAAPFGGFKQSGYGKDLGEFTCSYDDGSLSCMHDLATPPSPPTCAGEEALNEYLQTKVITVEY